ncbi:MAG: hypothetical protein O3A25_02740 [Acidobacteria bacterium]|nr:hypothetical protein [Acidobacteriota bacterium]
MTSTLLERGTKPFILLSLVGAGVMTVTTAVEWPQLRWVSLFALVASYVAARRFGDRVASAWLAVTYLAPALAMLGLGAFRLWDLTPWFAGLLGAMVATADPTRWHLPVSWRAPLVSWGLLVAVSWPVVWLRELDFAPSILSVADVANNGLGVSPGIGLLWVYGVTVTQGAGLILLDWFFAVFGRDASPRFQRAVVVPLGVGWCGAWAVGVYQSAVDPAFLNLGHWTVLRRASGTLMDANPFGMVAALWGAIGLALVFGRCGTVGDRLHLRALMLSTLVFLGSWYGLWISGSRSALGAGVVILGFVLWQLMQAGDRLSRRRRLTLGMAVPLLACVVWAAASSASLMVGPWERLAAQRPSVSVDSIRAVATELWDRNRYGTTAMQIIGDSPYVGVGVGAFHLLVPDVSHELGHGRLEGDNAQNWFRHQVAELGVLGSLGSLLWVALFLRLLSVGRPKDGAGPSSGLVRGALVALGLASLVGMPTQNAAVTVTFWVLVFWYTGLVQAPGGSPPRWLDGPRTWAAVWAIGAIYVVGLTYVSWVDLRVPFRAQRADWDYAYGFYEPEFAGTTDEFRWASRRALAVVPVGDRWIEVTAWTQHPDQGERPVDLTVWIDGTPLIESRREDGEPITASVRIPEGRLRVVIETEVERTWRPSDRGEADTRELGPGVRWRFIDP